MSNVYVPTTILDTFQYSLFAPTLPEVGKRNPSLSAKLWIHKSNIAFCQAGFVVITHDSTATKKYQQSIEIKTTLQATLTILNKVIEYAKSTDTSNKTFVIECKGPKIENGKMVKGERVSQGKLVVCRDEQGVFISVLSWNSKMPRIKFYPGLCNDREIDSTVYDTPERKREFINASAVGWADAVKTILLSEWEKGCNNTLEVMRRENPPQNNNKQFGGNSGGSRGFGGNDDNPFNDSFSSESNSGFDDMPF